MTIASSATGGSIPVPETEFPFTSRFVEVDGHRLHYVDEGEGPTLLFLTGGVVWSFIFRDVIDAIRHRFRTVALDLPGAGFSTPAQGFSQTLEAQSDVVEGFIDTLGLSEITIIAHDLGGPIGLGVYARRPELFTALAAMSTFGFPLDSHQDIVKELRRFTGSFATALNRKVNVVARFTSTRLGVGRHLTRAGKRAFLAPFTDPRVRNDGMALLGNALRSGKYLSVAERALRAAPPDLPVLLLYGERDPGRLAGFQDHFGEIFPQARSCVVKGAHHFPQCDAPEEVAGAIASWHDEMVVTPDR